MNKLRTALRDGTREAHERLDGMFSSLDLTRREHYRRFLAAQEIALRAVERGLDAADAGSVIPDWAERRRAAALREDLDALGEPLDGWEPPVDWIDDPASVLGAAYVLEGSRLGGKMMLKTVLASPDPAVAGATRFLGHGEGKRFWPTFDALLGATDLSEAETRRMVESARRTFELFEVAARRAMETAHA